jgi:uncharacterized protein (DUF302 family)
MMNRDNLYFAETSKQIDQFVRDLGDAARAFGFVIHNEDTMAMAHTFGAHGVEVAEGFDLHMIQVCKPEKAAKILSKNPERAILMPKFIMVFSKKGSTQIRFLRYSGDTIRAVVDDEEFPGSLAETFVKIVEMIEEAL